MNIDPRAIIVWTVSVLLLASVVVTTDTGTTVGIQQIVVGRCLDYRSTKYKNILPRVSTDCSKVWNNFAKAFEYKDPCDVSMKDYEQFLADTLQALPENKVMLWSGLFAFAHRFSDGGQRYVTLEDTLLGFLADDLRWCGQTGTPGIDYKKCPAFTSCPKEVVESFWGAASKMFASQAKGAVTIMLDGSNPKRPSYRTDSFFAKYELPNLNVQYVPSMTVLLVHSLSEPVHERCGTGSLVQLEADVKARGLKFTCEDNPTAVLFLLCADDPNSPQCDMARRHMQGWLPRPKESVYINSKPDSF